MTALLKLKSKVKIQRKPRVTYEVAPSLKRIRDGLGAAEAMSQAQTQAQT